MRPREAPPLSSSSNSDPGNHGQPSLLSRLAAMNSSNTNNQSENSTFPGKSYIISYILYLIYYIL